MGRARAINILVGRGSLRSHTLINEGLEGGDPIAGVVQVGLDT